jgi:radical SAM-linked protein
MAYRIRAIFSKTGDMRFVSHLDLMRLFQRASRRAGLPVTVTKGFNPHLKISITKALKLGLESPGEEAVFHIDRALRAEDFMSSINSKLPEGVKILSALEEKGAGDA